MSELLNLIGLSTGVALYAMLLVMVVRARRAPSAARFDPLLLSTAILGLVWNLSALPAYELPKLGIPGPFPLLTAIGFSALGFLPAVVVQSVLRGERTAEGTWVRRSITVTAYIVSAVAAVLQTYAAWHGDTAVGVRHAAADLRVLRAGRAALLGHARSTWRAPDAVGCGAVHLRGVGASPQPVPSR